MVTSDSIVVGAGVVGLSTALQLARHGQQVTVLEAGVVGSGASRTNAGWVVPSMSEPVPSPHSLRTAIRWLGRSGGPLKIRPRLDADYVGFLGRMLWAARPTQFHAGLAATATLAGRAVEAFDELDDMGLRYERHRLGTLMLFESMSELSSHIKELDFDSEAQGSGEVITADVLGELEPAVSSAVRGAVRYSHDECVDPGSVVDALYRSCVDAGVSVIENTRVIGISGMPEGVMVAVADDEQMAARSLIIAAGSQTGQVARLAGVRLPMLPGKGYGIDLPAGSATVRHALYLTEHKVAVTPLDGGVRACGRMEFGSTNRDVDPAVVASLSRSIGSYLPTLSAPPVATWAGLRPMTTDGLPVIGQLRDDAPIFVAGGHAMLGVTLGPLTGRLMAEIVVSRQVPDVVVPFSPMRFGSVRRSR